MAEAGASLDFKRLFPKLKIDAAVTWPGINLELAASLETLAPFGQNNPQPRLVSYGLRVEDVITMGFNNQHLKFRLANGVSNQADVKEVMITTTRPIWALAFGAAEEYKDYQIGDLVDIVYSLSVNDFNGRREVQLKIIDLRPAEPAAEKI